MSKMFDVVLDGIEERVGLVSSWRAFADHRIDGGVRLRHSFLAVIIYLFVQQAVLGVVLATYYSPSATDAWASTAYLSDQVTLGWLVRGLHYHGATAMVIVSGLWVLQQVLHRAYQAPREVTFWIALATFALSLVLGISGNPLPWDQDGYWGIQVELGIAEQTPGGGMIRTMIQGGSDAGNFTILRLYALHIFALPGVLAGLVWLAVRQRRRHGVPAPADMPVADARSKGQAYFPGQFFVDVLAISVVAGALVAATVASQGAELFAPADPTENFQARPVWYFLALYKLRMAFEGPMEPIATMVIPGAVAAFLVGIPVVDKFGGKAGRLLALVGTGLVATGFVALTLFAMAADGNNEDYQTSLAHAKKRAESAREYAKLGTLPLGGSAVFFNDPQYKVKQLFKEHCLGCHSVDEMGGEEAPAFDDYASRAWLAALIRNPKDPKFYGNTELDMDPYPVEDLPQDQLDAVVEFLVSIEGEGATVDAALVAKGKTLWEDELECNACHEIDPGADADGPNLLGHGSKAWVARVIHDSSKADLFGTNAVMPKFASKLGEQEIADLAAYVVSLRESVVP